MDGAKGWTLDRCIVLPLIKDTIKTISILSVSAGFLLYNEVYFLTNGAAGTKSISFLIRELAVVSPRAQYARANAIGAIQILGGLVLIQIINMLFRERTERRQKMMSRQRKGKENEAVHGVGTFGKIVSYVVMILVCFISLFPVIWVGNFLVEGRSSGRAGIYSAKCTLF